MGGKCNTHGRERERERNANKTFVTTPKRKRLLERPSSRWEDNIKIDLKEISYADVDWIRLAQDRVQWVYVKTYKRQGMS
jgi:hypothetical protein